MASDNSTIRLARREDVPVILQLICDLAEYEHEVESVEATEKKLLDTLSFEQSMPETTDRGAVPISPGRPARCLLAFTGDIPVGLALYFYNYSTWRARPGIYLEDLFVVPSYRKKGIGRKLLVALAKEVVAMDGGRLEWSVLKWNEPSIKFYESLGAKMMREWVGMRVDGDDLAQLAG